VDAGVDAGAPAVVRRSTDLRTALVQMYPEYRDTALLETEVTLTRTIPGLTPEKRDAALSKLRWQPMTDGGAGWELNRFHLTNPSPEKMVITLPLTVDDVGHLFLSPTSLSSMEMAVYFPRDLPIASEVFEMRLHYATSPERARLRARQAVSLLLANGQWKVTDGPVTWSPDASADENLPDTFAVEVTGTDGARIIFERTRGQVWVRYRLETVSGR
jgi:hypothetical protein